VGNIVSVVNSIARLPDARNMSARFAGDLPFGPDYIEKTQQMFGTDLIGFYVGNEPPGSTAAVDYSPFGYHGAYTSVKLGQQGIGEHTCPLYDGSTSYVQPPAGFRSAFNSQEGTAFCLIRNNIPWANATARGFVRLMVDAGNLVSIQKDGANSLNFYYVAGGTTKTVPRTTVETGWLLPGITWSKSNDRMKTYFDGGQVGQTQVGLGVWTGVLAPTNTVFGALTATPTGVWDGWEAYVAVVKREATPAEMARVAEL